MIIHQKKKQQKSERGGKREVGGFRLPPPHFSPSSSPFSLPPSPPTPPLIPLFCKGYTQEAEGLRAEVIQHGILVVPHECIDGEVVVEEELDDEHEGIVSEAEGVRADG